MPFHSVSSSICPYKNLRSLNTLSVADISLLRKSRIFHIKPSINASALGTQSINGFKQKKPHKAEIAYKVFWTLRISTFVWRNRSRAHISIPTPQLSTPCGSKDVAHMRTPLPSKAAWREKTSKRKKAKRDLQSQKTITKSAEGICLQETTLSQLGLFCFHGFGKSETLEKNYWVYSKQDIHWWMKFSV